MASRKNRRRISLPDFTWMFRSRSSREMDTKDRTTKENKEEKRSNWESELDTVRKNLQGNLRKFDQLLSAQCHALKRREDLVGAVMLGASQTNLGSSDSKKKAKFGGNDRLSTSAGLMSKSLDKCISLMKVKQTKVKKAEKIVPYIEPYPLVRLRLAQIVKDQDPKLLQQMLISNILVDRKLNLQSLYHILGQEILSPEELEVSRFTKWFYYALGEGFFPDGIIRCIYEYKGVPSPDGMEWKLEMSSMYSDLANTYESLVDGKHGFPGAGTRSGAGQFIQAVFPCNVRPSRILLSQPTGGTFRMQGWHNEGNYLHRNVVIQIPDTYDRYLSGEAKWITVGNVDSTLVREDGAIPVALDVPSTGSRVFRLTNSDSSLHTYMVTGTFEFS